MQYQCANPQPSLGNFTCASPDGNVQVHIYKAIAYVDFSATAQDGSQSKPLKLTFDDSAAKVSIPSTPDNGSLSGMSFEVLDQGGGSYSVYALT